VKPSQKPPNPWFLIFLGVLITDVVALLKWNYFVDKLMLVKFALRDFVAWWRGSQSPSPTTAPTGSPPPVKLPGLGMGGSTSIEILPLLPGHIGGQREYF
jgi:hypothetical protein